MGPSVDAAGLLAGDPKAPDQLSLAVSGKRYAGWLSADIERSLEVMTPSFDISYVDRWVDQGLPWPIREGEKAELFFGPHLLITGRVNAGDWTVSAEEWSLRSQGRSLCGDLEDCSAIHTSGVWKKASPLKIISELIADYGLKVTTTAADGMLPLNRFLLQEGETVRDAIERLCTQVALLPVSKPDGNLELLRADIPRDKVIVLPVEQAIQRRVSTSEQDRYSNYYAIGQSHGDKNRAGEAVVAMKDTVTDKGMARHRPVVLLAAHSVAQRAALTARATWERNVRAGRAMRYYIIFPGVLGPDGKPYTPGAHALVKDLALGVDDTLVITRANIRASAAQLVTEVELTPPAAYSVLEYPPKKKLNPKPKKPKPEPEVCIPQSEAQRLGIAF